MILLRRSLRHCFLTAAGNMIRRGPSHSVRFFYGHSMGKRDVGRFRRILGMLARHYTFVSTREAIELLTSDDRPTGRYAAFSFDDGFRDNFEYVAPLLREFGASACFFVTTNFIESDGETSGRFLAGRFRQDASKGPMTWAMLRQLIDEGFEVGSHTLDHLNCSEISVEEAERQAREAKEEIEARLGAPCPYFAWPYGLRRDFPEECLPRIGAHFAAVFSAIRSRDPFSYDGRVINREHFEPWWPASHVRYFALRAKAEPPLDAGLRRG